MYVDSGSSIEILYENCFNRLRPEIKSQMVPATTSLTGFSVETIWLLGQLRLLTENKRNSSGAIHSSRKMLKFPVEGGIVTIRSTILIPTECTSVNTSSVVSKEERTRPDNFKVALHPDFPDQEVAIRGTLSDKGRTKLCSILKKNLDIFAWQPSDKTGVPRSVAEHRLNIREGYSPVRQKKRGQAPERAKAIQAEPLLEIDWKVESLYGYTCKYFLDAYKGYHQIQLAEPDEEKIAFHTGQGVYCYTKMPFGPKNAGTTYQRLMDKAFDTQIYRNIEVYVHDLVVKSYTEAEMLRDIKETFRTLGKINMKLNPKKYAFGLAEGMFLGYVVTPDGIKPSEQSLQLFKTLKKCIKKSDFHWTAEAEQDFKQLKQHLLKLPLLVAPKLKEELIIYLSATYGAISAVLMTERGATQTPIYFISRVLQGLKLNYTPIEKLVLSLVFAAKRLRWYFQAHPITVITDQPIKQIMSRSIVAGRLQKWSIMLGEHIITYMPRTSVKGQILADFLIEMPDEDPQAAPVVDTQQEPWTLFTDGSSCVDGSGVSVDSKLVANQVLRTYVSKEDNMVKYLDKVKSSIEGFTNFSISQVPRSKNKKADALSKIASTSFTHLSKQVLVEVLKDKSIKEKEEGGKKAPHQNPTVRVNGGNSLQAVIPHAVVKMCWTAPGEGEIVSDNDKQFSDNPFKDWCDKLNITQRFASVKHPQSNRLIERENRSLGEGIKARLGKGNKNWVEELPHVLWAHRTMIKSSHGDTPFSLTYGTEAVIPTEIGMPTYRIAE
uniref:Reverse transcriptase domain-containing protein n=1 Tax=Tanacetum cinerariifolium TaxID=118510 RepID=A0A699I0U5_TANCI|nr:reverse transcriptase domain-containing protein [Tanacetum cinerariifolium]